MWANDVIIIKHLIQNNRNFSAKIKILAGCHGNHPELPECPILPYLYKTLDHA